MELHVLDIIDEGRKYIFEPYCNKEKVIITAEKLNFACIEKCQTFHYTVSTVSQNTEKKFLCDPRT